MAYNNSFPMSYQPMQMYYPQVPAVQQTQPQQQQTTTTGVMNTGIIWVQGEAGAKSYLVAPNTTVQLWDSESQVIYLKSADSSGMPTMKILDYTIRDNNNNTQAVAQQISTTSDFATISDINSLKDELNALKEKIDSLNTSSTNSSRRNYKKEGNRIE